MRIYHLFNYEQTSAILEDQKMIHKLFNLVFIAFLSLITVSATAASKAEIDAGVQVAIQNFYEESPAGKILAE